MDKTHTSSGPQTLNGSTHPVVGPLPAYGNYRPGQAAASTSNGQMNMLSLMKALRKKAWRAILFGLLVGAVVAAALWFIVPPDPHVVTSTVRLDPNPHGILFPSDKQVNPDDFRKDQEFKIKGDHQVLSYALDNRGVKELEMVRSEIDPVRELQKDLEVEFRGGKYMTISLPGQDPEAQKKILTALLDSYVYHFQKEESADKRNRIESLKASEKKLAQEVAAKEDVKRTLENESKAFDFEHLKSNQTMSKMIFDLANTELVKIRFEKLTIKPQLDNEYRKFFASNSLIACGSSHTGLPVNLTVAHLLQFRSEAEPVDVTDSAVDGTIFSSDEMLFTFNEKIAELKYKMGMFAKAFQKEKADLLIEALKKEIETKKKEIDQRKEELIANAAPQRFVNKLAFLRQKWNSLIDYESGVMNEVQKLGTESDKYMKIGQDMRKLDTELDDLNGWLTKVRAELVRSEIEEDAPSRIQVPQPATVYHPPPIIGRRETMAAVGGTGAFFFILFAFAWFEFRARRIDSREEIMQTLGMTPIGALPDFTYRPRIGFLGAGKNGDNAKHRILMDSVDAARNMILSTAADEKLQVLLVTSAMVGEGKTSSAGHLAASLARTGRKTLLIDCDLRNPNIHRLFNAVRTPGLSEVLRGECDVSETVQELSTENLSLIAAGQFNLQTLKYFSQNRIKEIIDRLREEYEFIVLDSSPILLVPECHSLAQHSDAVIMSVLRNVSKLPNLHHATEILSRLGARTLGFIMNGVRDRSLYASSYYTIDEAEDD